ncbi:MAG: signal peptidase I, partial [Kofleriaceae bacterium]
MRSSRLDRHVRREARQLVRTVRGALARHGGVTGAREELEHAARTVERALADRDLARVRRELPVLDALVDAQVRSAQSPLSIGVEYGWAILSLLALVFGIRAFVVEAFKIPSSSMYPTLEINDHIFVNKFVYGLRIPWTQSKLFERSPARGEVIVFAMPCEPERDYIKRVVGLAGDTVEMRCNTLYVNGAVVPSTRIDEPCVYEDRDDDQVWYPVRCARYRERLGDYTYDAYYSEDRPRFDAAHRDRAEHGDGAMNDFPLHEAVRRCPAATNQAPGRIELVSADGPRSACDQQLRYVVPAGHVFVMGDNRDRSNDSRFWGSVPLENIKGKALFIWASYRDWGPLKWSEVRWDRVGAFVHILATRGSATYRHPEA